MLSLAHLLLSAGVHHEKHEVRISYLLHIVDAVTTVRQLESPLRNEVTVYLSWEVIQSLLQLPDQKVAIQCTKIRRKA